MDKVSGMAYCKRSKSVASSVFIVGLLATLGSVSGKAWAVADPVAPPGTFTLDCDLDGNYTPLGDGLTLIRYMFSFPGDSLTKGAVATNAARSSATDIAAYLAKAGNTLDVDGNGLIEPLADGLLIVRYLFSFTGDSLIKGAVGTGATRTTAAEISAYIKSLMPVLYNNSRGMSFRQIPAGSMTMGSPAGETSRYSDEGPQHTVAISKSFYMQTTEVTQGQWKAVMGSNPSYFGNCGDACPVEQVSWNDVQNFLTALNTKGEGTYRLPTEAEWEYAARAGATTTYSFGASASQLGDYAWYGGNSSSKTHAVATKLPNSWGLYDMHGNVHEWVSDWYGDYTATDQSDPSGPTSGYARVFRGGSWFDDARGNSWFSYAGESRSAYRDYWHPGHQFGHLGFRVVVTPSGSANLP